MGECAVVWDAREVRALSDDTTFSGRADSFITAAEGHDGGLPGSHCRIVVKSQSQKNSDGAQLLTTSLAAGERIRMEIPGGGGLEILRVMVSMI